MTVLTNLTATASQADDVPVPKNGLAVNNKQRSFSFNATDLYFFNGVATVKVSQAELWKMVEAAEPKLKLS